MIKLDFKTDYFCKCETIRVAEDHDYLYDGTLEELLHEEKTKYFSFCSNEKSYINLFLKDEFGEI